MVVGREGQADANVQLQGRVQGAAIAERPRPVAEVARSGSGAVAVVVRHHVLADGRAAAGSEKFPPATEREREARLHPDEIGESAAVGSDLAPDGQDPSTVENPFGIGLQSLLTVVLSMPVLFRERVLLGACMARFDAAGDMTLEASRDAAGVRAAVRDATRRCPHDAGPDRPNSSVRVT